MTDLLVLARALIPVVREAGALELTYYKEGEKFKGVMSKGDGSPVTIADQEAEVLIEKALKALAPHIPMVGEEATSAGIIPDISSGTFMLVDALDGTREFMEGRGDFTVNIAYLVDFVPVMGIIYAPVSGELYFGANGQAFHINKDGFERRIAVRDTPKEGITVVGSRSSDNADMMKEYLKAKNVREFIPRSSSLKFCVVAAGEADLFPRLGPTCEWDTAAGEAIVRAAGGRVTTLDGQPMKYGKKDRKFLNPGFLAFSR